MLRIRTVILMITFEAIGYEAVKPTRSLSIQFILAAIMLGALYMSATCFNDVADEKIDKVNLAHDETRPLMTTNVTSRQLRNLGIIALTVSMVMAVLISPIYIIFVLCGAIISIFYSLPPIQISHRGIFASLWLTLSYVVLPFLVGAFLQTQTLDAMSRYILLAVYVSFIGRILLKDFRDYEGDKKFGKLNFLVRHGPKKTCFVAVIAWLLGDLIISWSLFKTFPILIILVQPIVIVIMFGLYLLAYEKKYTQKLLEVIFVGRMGNSIALALLAALTLQAFHYSTAQKNLTIVAIGAFVSVSAITLWRDGSLVKDLRDRI